MQIRLFLPAGQNGDSFFKSVTVNETDKTVTIVLNDNAQTTFTIPLGATGLAAIKSMTYMPTHDDGKATVLFPYGYTPSPDNAYVDLKFQITPASATSSIKAEHLRAEQLVTETRAQSNTLPIKLSSSGEEVSNGIISVKVELASLDPAFWSGDEQVSVRVVLNDGEEDVLSTEYIPLYFDASNNISVDYTASAAIQSPGAFANFYNSTTGKGVVIFQGTAIPDSAFCYCTTLKSVIIPEGVTEIGDSAFQYCKALTSITIPEGVTEIGMGAFGHCPALKSVSLPASVTAIANMAFNSCSKLDSVTCLPTNPPTLGDGVFASCAVGLKIYVPAESVDEYNADINWSTYSGSISSAIPSTDQ